MNCALFGYLQPTDAPCLGLAAAGFSSFALGAVVYVVQCRRLDLSMRFLLGLGLPSGTRWTQFKSPLLPFPFISSQLMLIYSSPFPALMMNVCCPISISSQFWRRHCYQLPPPCLGSTLCALYSLFWGSSRRASLTVRILRYESIYYIITFGANNNNMD